MAPCKGEKWKQLGINFFDDSHKNHPTQVGKPPGPDGRVEVHLVDLGSTSVLPIAALRTGVHSQLSQVL